MSVSTAGLGSDLDQLLFPTEGTIDLSESLRIKIVSRLFQHGSLSSSPTSIQPSCWTAYFDYFANECYNWRGTSKPVAIETYGDFLNLVDHLRTNSGEPQSSVKVFAFFPPRTESVQYGSSQHATEFLEPLATRRRFCSEASVFNAMNLTVRLWLMINVGSSDTTVSPAKSCIEWPHDKSLQELVSSTFHCEQSSKPQELGHWSKALNAYNLDRIGGFKILWTSNLADHLYLDEDLEIIRLYHHANVLKGHRRDRAAGQILPDGLMDETLHTLALILPRVNRKCQKWFEKEQRVQRSFNSTLDPLAADQQLGRRGRSVTTYRYWNNRLARLAEVFDKSEPKGVLNWWMDRRNRVQWYTFWVAATVLALTLVFGLIQSITGVLQVYAAYNTPRRN